MASGSRLALDAFSLFFFNNTLIGASFTRSGADFGDRRFYVFYAFRKHAVAGTLRCTSTDGVSTANTSALACTFAAMMCSIYSDFVFVYVCVRVQQRRRQRQVVLQREPEVMENMRLVYTAPLNNEKLSESE